MHEIRLTRGAEVAQWWAAVAACRVAGTRAEDAHWRVDDGQSDLFARASGAVETATVEMMREVPVTGERKAADVLPAGELRDLVDKVLLHSDARRFALAHRLVERATANPRLLRDHADADVSLGRAMEKGVRRDMHKMTAFVRFRKMTGPEGDETFVAWFEPEHHIVEATAPFFVRRFASMRWSILTPEACVHWDLTTLRVGPGAKRSDAPSADPLEDIWRSYYANIFNPARLKVKAMTAEMPKKYWRNLPEAELIVPMIRNAAARAEEMVSTGPTRARAASPVASPRRAPEDGSALRSLEDIKAAVDGCRRCALHCNATQGIPGEGLARASLMIVGEQPGDQEDLAGRPFVGPAGKLLDEALKRVGIARESAYVTNAVKHFKFEPRGKRRIHKKPDVSEIEACRWWLDGERKLLQPELILALGATATRAITGKAQPVTAVRGRVMPIAGSGHLLVTVHPSYLLRLQTDEDKRREWRAFLDDLAIARDWLAERRAA